MWEEVLWSPDAVGKEEHLRTDEQEAHYATQDYATEERVGVGGTYSLCALAIKCIIPIAAFRKNMNNGHYLTVQAQ